LMLGVVREHPVTFGLTRTRLDTVWTKTAGTSATSVRPASSYSSKRSSGSNSTGRLQWRVWIFDFLRYEGLAATSSLHFRSLCGYKR